MGDEENFLVGGEVESAGGGELGGGFGGSGVGWSGFGGGLDRFGLGSEVGNMSEGKEIIDHWRSPG